MLLINIFVIPIAMGGLLSGMPVEQADTFVLQLPMASGRAGLTLLVFIGGFSAATGMIMISAMTMATMITNHLLLPLIESFRALNFAKRYMLQFRWVAVGQGVGFITSMKPARQIVFDMVDEAITVFEEITGEIA